VDEELAIALRPENRRGDHAPRPESQLPGGGNDTLEDLPVDRRVPDDAVIRSAPTGLELGLDEGDDRDVGAGLQRRGYGPKDERKGDERDVDDGEAHRLRQRPGSECSGIRPLHRDDALVVAERIRELTTTHVDRIYAPCATLQQDICEAACRRAGVEAHATSRVNTKGVEGRSELVPATTDVRVTFRQRERRRCVEEVTRLAVEAGGIALPHPDPTCEHERLGLRPRLGEAPLDEELIEAQPGTPLSSSAVRSRGAHPRIVAQPASLRLISFGTEPMNRPLTLIGAVVLNLLIGLVGIFLGLFFVWAFLNGDHERIGISPSAAIPARIIIFGTPICGALAVIGAVGTWGRSVRGWWLSVAVDLVGLAFLVWAVSIDWLDSGAPLFATLGVALGLHVASSTRSALRD
jgi:hypothetical protein